MKVNKIMCMILLCMSVIINGCTKQAVEEERVDTEAENLSSESTSIVTYDSFDSDDDYMDEDYETITFTNDQITYEGSNASIANQTITINKAGTYVLEGTSDDANIIIDAAKEDQVHIVFNNLDLTSNLSTPFYVKQADKVVITLVEGSKNYLTDTANYTFAAGEDEPDATIFAKDDLTINGSGSLQVKANYKTAIKSKDDLKIMNGIIQVNAVDNGIQGKDLLAVKAGNITIESKGDGLKANNDSETDKGIICIEAGTINITAEQDGIQSDNMLYIYDGDITILSGGGSVNAAEKVNNDMFGGPFGSQTTSQDEDDTISCKGIKAVNALNIMGGSLNLDCADDTIHSNGTIIIDDGNLTLTSGDDGIHADEQLDINGSNIKINSSYEGLESSLININDGEIHLKASDDGINATTITDELESEQRSPDQGGDTSQLNIIGGYVYVDADGDGLDSNGNITMHDGTVIVNGPVNSGNGALDFDGAFDINGGTFIASGSSGMLQTPTTISNGNCFAIGVSLSAKEALHIQDSEGASILTFAPSKNSQSVVYYSTSLSTNSTYSVYTQGTASGTEKDGIYDGDYQNGTLYQEVTIQDTLTSIGIIQSGMGGMNGGGQRGGGAPGMNR